MIKLTFALTTIFILVKNAIAVGEELLMSTDEGKAQYRDMDWCYHKTKPCGEKQWPGICKTGKFQSPINLPGNITRYNLNTGPYKAITNFPKSSYLLQGYKMEFTGKTLQIWPIYEEDTERLSFRWVNHQEDINYTFHSLHFHWGSRNTVGSEHAIGGKSFSGEVHLVYFDSRWETMDNALASNYRNTVLVIAVFLEVDPVPANDENDNAIPFLESISKNLEQLRNAREYAELDGWLSLGDLFTCDKAYTYLGSLTTPKCTENVVWLVLRKPLLVPLAYLKAFRETRFKDGGTFYDNFRSLKQKREKTQQYANEYRDISIVSLSYV